MDPSINKSNKTERRPRLFGYWRSSASYRVRIALNLKELTVEHVPVNLRLGEQNEFPFDEINAAHLVPVFESGTGVRIAQSLAIIEYLDEVYPSPVLMGGSAIERAAIRRIALDISADIHPLGNLRVLQKLGRDFGLDNEGKARWNRHWVGQGFAALETTLAQTAGRFCVGDRVTLADICLVPQVYNARRFGLDLGPFPRIQAITAQASDLTAFADAAPEHQSDADSAP